MKPLDPNLVRVITAAETLPLRMSVLRPNRPREVAQFPDDDLPTSRHFGAFQNGAIVGIASLFHAPFPHDSAVQAIQLRGMATAPEVRGAGFGQAIVAACVAYAAFSGVAVIWCNARVSALGFYRKLGWEVIGPQFDIADVGPHFHMWRGLDRPAG